MKVGINGMGRIGRLALRAAMGAAERQLVLQLPVKPQADGLARNEGLHHG